MSSVGVTRMVILTALISTIIPSIAFLPHFTTNTSATAQTSASSASDVQSDFNGDGYDDLAVGVQGEDIGTAIDAGGVSVMYGSSSGLGSGPAGDGTGRADQFWHQNSPGVEDAAEASDRFGSSVAPGDFNGDGYDDLAIGVVGENIGTIVRAGAVNVLYGSSSGLRTTSPADQFWHQNSPGVENTAESDDNFGSALAAGDFNNDGKDDLAIGVPGESIGTLPGVGSVNVLYGSSVGLRTTSPADQFWHQGKPGVEDNEEADERFGSSLAAGDFNDDNKDDLAIGVPGYDTPRDDPDYGDFADTGAANVLYGSSSGLQASSPNDQYFTQCDSPDEYENSITELFGQSLAVGDYDGDGYDDLAVGEPGDTIYLDSAYWAAGSVCVYYGSASGLQSVQHWHQDVAGVEDAVGRQNFFGQSLVAGDFNGDGEDDLAIGAIGEESVNVLYGSPVGLRTTSPADQFWNQNSAGVENTVEFEDSFGSSLFAADFNNDGKDDLAIGVAGEDIGAFSNAGAVNVLYGSPLRLQTSSPVDQFWHQGKPGVEDSEETGDLYGGGGIVSYY